MYLAQQLEDAMAKALTSTWIIPGSQVLLPIHKQT